MVEGAVAVIVNLGLEELAVVLIAIDESSVTVQVSAAPEVFVVGKVPQLTALTPLPLTGSTEVGTTPAGK